MRRTFSVILGIILIMTSVLTSVGFTSIPVQSIKLDSTKINMVVGQTGTLTVTITPSNATDKKLIFSSGNKKIATVDKNGKITAVGKGNTVITVTSSSNKKLSVKCNITVKQKEKLPVIDVSIADYYFSVEDQDAISKDRIKKYIEDKFKINLKIKASATSDEFKQKMILAMSTGDAPDLVVAYPDTSMVPAWSKDGALTNLQEIVSKDPIRYSVLNLILKNPLHKYFNYVFYGNSEKSYALYQLQKGGIVIGVPFINGKYLKKVNLQPPTTIDEFEKVLRAFKNGDPDGNGKNDTIPFSFFFGKGTYYWEIGGLLFTAYGTHATGFYKDSKGEWIDSNVDPKAKEPWKRLAKWYQEGLIDKEIFSANSDGKLLENFINGKFGAVSYLSGWREGVYTYLFREMKKLDPNLTVDDIVMPPHPMKGPDGYSNYGNVPLAAASLTCIPKTCKNPERVLDLLNWIASDEGQTILWYGIQGVHYTKNNGKIQINVAERAKEAKAYAMKGDPIWSLGKVSIGCWRPFARIVSGNGYVQIEKAGGDLEKAIDNGFDPFKSINEPEDKSPEVKRDKEYCEIYKKEGYVPQEIIKFGFSLPDEELKLSTALTQIQNKWIAEFLTGAKNVDTGWDAYVKEYKEAGGDKVLKKYREIMAANQKVWDDLMK